MVGNSLLLVFHRTVVKVAASSMNWLKEIIWCWFTIYITEHMVEVNISAQDNMEKAEGSSQT